MTSRERFRKAMHFEPVDRVPILDMNWYWPETIARWQKEGLPADVQPVDYFELDYVDRIPADKELMPPFEEETLEEDSEIRLYRDTKGIIKREFKKDRTRSMPQWVKFPIETKEDWKEIRRRLDPYSPARLPMNWDALARGYHDRKWITRLYGGSLFGYLRDLMGFERILMTFHDDPLWLHEMIEYMMWFFMESNKKVLETETIEVDICFFWEDMAFKNGPMISPKMFEEFLVLRYKKMTEFYRSYGIEFFFVDCDGDASALIPLWIEGGLNGFYPIEIAAGMDPLRLKKTYGKSLCLLGGIDKRVLAMDKAAIERELRTKLPYLLQEGGYILWPDHFVPPDVSLENFRYFIELAKEISTERIENRK